MSQTRSVDDLLVKVAAEQVNQQAPVQPIPEVSSPDPVPEATEVAETVPQPTEAQEKVETETDNKVTTEPEAKADSPIDEYGNPIEKPRMYTEEELQQRIRERLSRGRHAEQPTQQQVQQASKDFAPDPNSEESWEAQLEAFVDRTIEKRERTLSEKQWRQEEAQRQAEFEEKFTTGMSKYQDFREVVTKLPISNEIMLAARALDNPAAFIYAASKLHPGEIQRISQIRDPYTAAAEVGRLHERMVKAKNATSKAGKPLDTPKSDMAVAKDTDRPSIDNLIRQHEKQKFGSKR